MAGTYWHLHNRIHSLLLVLVTQTPIRNPDIIYPGANTTAGGKPLSAIPLCRLNNVNPYYVNQTPYVAFQLSQSCHRNIYPDGLVQTAFETIVSGVMSNGYSSTNQCLDTRVDRISESVIGEIIQLVIIGLCTRAGK